MLADLVEKRLFDVAVIDVKAARVVAPKCPECGRRGYCLRVCRRSHLSRGALVDTFDLRWQYVAQVLFSSTSFGSSCTSRDAGTGLERYTRRRA